MVNSGFTLNSYSAQSHYNLHDCLVSPCNRATGSQPVPTGRHALERAQVRDRGAQTKCLSLYLGARCQNTLRQPNWAGGGQRGSVPKRMVFLAKYRANIVPVPLFEYRVCPLAREYRVCPFV